ncbi:phosphotransferase family protein [Aspergillus neoniger CBS 115656]|uniref:Altered inheritance of mitochondria protein 9, mitochondrial n=1 Tax=Aspergillus neoniger (strain CBS 115656) TaxID=1448310 RepID=A0A318Z254_ASPNB|nr:phosphotransferase enzyme family protein [Aspergillus neoniger CBS 115656]PYH38993.1 phosphotransferase enzyme family protein [Aspergillus neoniger CBS 115656]
MNQCPAAPLCRYSYIQYTQKALKQPYRPISRASTLSYNVTPTSRTSSQTDWNNHDEFFKFTRGRFLVDEAKNRRMREIQFDMNSLARVAAESVGATHCTSIQKYPDGMFKKAFLMSMDNGREVVAKVTNPNAGIPHLRQLARLLPWTLNVLETPVPRVYTWNSNAQSHPVGAEFIIMEKAAGVPLSHVWETLKLPQKLQVLLAMIRLQKKWLSVSFSHYGSLHPLHQERQFAIGPTTGRDWCDASRSLLDIDRGPWPDIQQFLQAVGTRETKAIQSLHPPKQLALFCGPKLYQPCPQTKLTALSHYHQILESLIPNDTALTTPHLWHNDLHNDNIFIDPQNPESITSIIDWQSTHISPLFTHNPDPAFLDWTDAAAVREYTTQNIFIGWRKLTRAKNPALYRAIEFRKTPAYRLIFLAHRMFEYGEAQFMSLLVDMRDHWGDLPGTGDVPFPFEFTDAEIERIKVACDGAVAGTELVAGVKEQLGDLWPDKGLIENERYEECRAALGEVRDRIVEELAESEEYRRWWPFD